MLVTVNTNSGRWNQKLVTVIAMGEETGWLGGDRKGIYLMHIFRIPFTTFWIFKNVNILYIQENFKTSSRANFQL